MATQYTDTIANIIGSINSGETPPEKAQEAAEEAGFPDLFNLYDGDDEIIESCGEHYEPCESCQ